jgi:hypothetical protein
MTRLSPSKISPALALALAACSGESRAPAVLPSSARAGGTLPLSEAGALVLLDALRSAPGAIPEGWEGYQFSDIPRWTEFQVAAAHDGGLALRARSEDAASALRRRVEIDPRRFPWVSWSWCVETAVPGADVERKESDDSPARVLLLYRFEPAAASIFERAQFEALRRAHGECPPSAMVVYFWADGMAPGTAFTSPRSSRVKLIAVGEGAGALGVWHRVRRNHLEDYRSLFGAEPPALEAVALMADTDETHAGATSWWRELAFEAVSGAPR